MKGPIRFRGSLSVPCFNMDLTGSLVRRFQAGPSNLTIIPKMRMIGGSNMAGAITMSKKIMTLFMAINVGLVIKY
jgi:hypothetical protein